MTSTEGQELICHVPAWITQAVPGGILPPVDPPRTVASGFDDVWPSDETEYTRGWNDCRTRALAIIADTKAEFRNPYAFDNLMLLLNSSLEKPQ